MQMRVNLIPMAGEGQRFKDAGYTIPKPLIDIHGIPMVVRAAKALPFADKWIFVCREAHLEISEIKTTLYHYFPDALIVPVERLTQGQAITCMLAREHIPEDATLTIGPSDNDMTYDENQVEAMFHDATVDGWIWTFRNNPLVLQNPAMYGWVKSENNSDKAIGVSCKKTISETPLNDPAVIGAFTFKRAKVFFDAVDLMVKANDRINNEFYVDVAAEHAIRAGHNIRAFEVDRYIGWGTPKDYQEYEYWRGYFFKRGLQ
jgi:dTDP-glucose pyrophosphorylase